jgi:hypothetical protein
MSLNGDLVSVFVPEMEAPLIAPAIQPITTVTILVRDKKTWRGMMQQ